jgi:hypothetical protein
MMASVKEVHMGIRNRGREELSRMECKTLDARFKQEVQHGLNCSLFEAEALVKVVKEVYLPFIEQAAPVGPPGKITLVAVSADETAGKPVADCEKRTVCLTVHAGIEDDKLLSRGGAEAFRQAKIPALCQEALSQGALLTREDLAYRIFFVSPRTISRDLAALRQAHPEVPIPLRSTVHDIGPMLTHRVQIVRLALAGKTTSQICNITRHSPAAVANYLSNFTRCAHLAKQGLQPGQIAFLLQRGEGLVKRYLELLSECAGDRNLAYHLDELLRLGRVEGKKISGRRSGHGRQG